MSSSRKRKHHTNSHSSHHYTKDSRSVPIRDPSPDFAIFAQAYEADIIRGPSATFTAPSLEVYDYDNVPMFTTQPQSKVGDALICWGGIQLGISRPAFPGDEDDDMEPMRTIDGEKPIWVDRYDARLLLESLPIYSPSGPEPSSPGGWSDLPSDTEDTFFFSPEEAEDFRRDKRRRLIDRNREERLKARQAEDGVVDEEEEVWGGSDEEPDEPQKELMRRTATHLLSSPNPAQLEMRILANHGSDKRFAFLRGRWSRTWKMCKGKARMEKEAEEQKNKTVKGLGILAGYGDSDAESDASDGDAKDTHQETSRAEPEISDTPAEIDVNPLQEARRLRAKEWAEKRRAAKEGN